MDHVGLAIEAAQDAKAAIAALKNATIVLKPHKRCLWRPTASGNMAAGSDTEASWTAQQNHPVRGHATIEMRLCWHDDC